MDWEWLVKHAEKFNLKFDFETRKRLEFPASIRAQTHENLKSAYTIYSDDVGRFLMICKSFYLSQGVIIAEHIKTYIDALPGQKEVLLINLNTKEIIWAGEAKDLPIKGLKRNLPYGPGYPYDPEDFAERLPELPDAQGGQSAPVTILRKETSRILAELLAAYDPIPENEYRSTTRYWDSNPKETTVTEHTKKYGVAYLNIDGRVLYFKHRSLL